ncbi:MAG: DsbC family protein [Nitrospiraceae bacterium]|nr:DsbC family protein [Nitrospiraceae bacterium]
MRHRSIVIMVTALLFFTASLSYGFSNKGENCAKCHTLKKEEAAALLKEIAPMIKVMDVRMTPLKSLWEIDVESNGRKGPVYLDITKRYLISGSIVDIKGKKNLTREREEDLNRVNVSQIPMGDALVMGDRNAKKKVIVFTDPECPFCAKLHQELKKVVAQRKDIAFYIKMFPLPIHKGSAEKAKTIVCEKSLKLLEEAYEKKPLPAPKCKTQVIDEDLKLGKKLGISGTPALVMPDGRVVSGYRDAKAIEALIDRK